MMNVIRDIKRGLLFVALGSLALTGCTKYANPPAVFEEQELEADKTVKRKVLFISMDGAVGAEVQKVMPTTIAGLLPNSKYSFEALTEENTSDPSTWMSMMSGIKYSKHHIESENFIPSPNENDPHATVTEYPSILYRLAVLQPTLRSYVVARDENIANRLLTSAYNAEVEASDAAVKEKVLEDLQRDRLDFLIVQFKDVLTAGVEYGFSADVSEYKAAIERVDGYVGEILAALRDRENYEYEDWLIILTSNHGGEGQSYGGESYAERNIFAIYANDKFKENELIPEIIPSYRFYGYSSSNEGTADGFRARNATPPASESVYNVATTGQLTAEAKIKMNQGTDGGYNYATNAPFFGKNANRYGSTPGWTFFKTGSSALFYMADGSTKIEGTTGAISSAGEWTHISAVMYSENGVPTAKVYVNGTLINTLQNANLDISKVTSTTGLTFGYYPTLFSGLPIDFQMADVHIWNRALTASEISENANRVGLTEEQLADASLVGYWPLDKLVDNKFKNQVADRPDLAVQGSSSLSLLSNTLPYVDVNSVLLQSTDIVTQVFYWFEQQTQVSWSLDGVLFLNNYEVEFIDN